MKINLAIVGIEGLPNKYGGFETLASYLAKYLSNAFNITVYCSSTDLGSSEQHFEDIHLKYLGYSSHGWQGVLYDVLSLNDALKYNDVVLFLGFGAGPYFPLLSKKNKSKIVLNFGGLDWQRSKWNKITRKVIQSFEAMMVKNVEWVVADNKRIAEYIQSTYHKKPVEIAYGGDQVKRLEITEELLKEYPFLNQPYACGACRIQSDNNVEMILHAFSKSSFPLIMIGNWDASAFGKKCLMKYKGVANLHLVNAIYDETKLNQIRSNCSIYVHGHSAGGTNPSLIEAMHLGLNIFAYTSGYNEITTQGLAKYFNSDIELLELVEHFNDKQPNDQVVKMQRYAEQNYTWEKVSAEYKDLFLKLYHQNNGA